MKRGHQWIHMDAQYPHGLGHDLTVQFGAAGQLVFVQFLCACKRAFPQGHIKYRSEDEALILLGASFPLVDNNGEKWWLEDLWKWLRYRRVVSTSRRNGLRMVSACHWDAWEMSGERQLDAERKRRSRAQKRPERPNGHFGQSPPEVGGGRMEVGGGSARGDRRGPRHANEGLQAYVNQLSEKKPKEETKPEADNA